MEPIKLSQKAEEEIVNAAKMAALSNLTEKSQNLITLKDIAIYFRRHYQTVAKIISKLPNFPKPVTVDQQNSRPRYIAGEVLRWGGSMLNILANRVIPPPPPYQGHNKHFVKSKYLYAQIFWLMSSHLLF